MNVWKLSLVLCLWLHAPAAAADEIISRLTSEKTDTGTTGFVSFAYGSCEDECQIATLICRESGSVELELVDVESKNVAKAITNERHHIELRAGARRYNYFITDMKFQELNGGWWVTAHEQGSKFGEIAAAIGAAKVIEARVGGSKVSLPGDANVKAWAAACK